MKSLEQQLFTWEGWDGDVGVKMYYNCCLKADIGKYEQGTKIPIVSIWEETSKMEFLQENGDVMDTFDLVLSVAQ